MSREMKILILNSAVIGALAGFALTRWGIPGVLVVLVLALALGLFLSRKG